ncbi:MAG: hypothetical protein LC649_07505 [Bacteroidales bacterium]|nr:hypothetical protein [Bacteroidales bacterium]
MAWTEKIGSAFIVVILLTIASCSTNRPIGISLYVSENQYSDQAVTEGSRSDSVDIKKPNNQDRREHETVQKPDTLKAVERNAAVEVPDNLQAEPYDAAAEMPDTLLKKMLAADIQKPDTLKAVERNAAVEVPDNLQAEPYDAAAEMPDTLQMEEREKTVQTTPDSLLPGNREMHHDTVFVEVPVRVEVPVPVEVPVRVEVPVPVEVPVRVEVPVPVEVPVRVEVPVPVEVPVEVNNLANSGDTVVADTLRPDSLIVITESDSVAATKQRILISQALLIHQQRDSLAQLKEQELIIRQQRDSLAALNNQALEDQRKLDSLAVLKSQTDSLAAEESAAQTRAIEQATPDTLILNYTRGSAEAMNKDDILRKIAEITTEKKPVTIILKGYTDRSGSAEVNRAITSRRLNLLRESLTGMGIDDTIIFTQNFGSQYASETIINEERRVEIVIRFSERNR